MKIVYYSCVGNTKRFVEKLQTHLEGIVCPLEDSMWKLDGPKSYRLESKSPHHQALNLDEVSAEVDPDLVYPPGWHRLPVSPPKVIIVFPVYARRNVETGELENTVPKCMQAFIAKHRSQIIGAVVCGNRTFGPAFAKVNPQELGGIPIFHRVELAGTLEDLPVISRAVRDL